MTDFLNPKSMVTPGMAGALVMFLSNAICLQFPEIAPRWAALVLSFALGAMVIAAANLPRLPAAGFWLINSLIIFAVAAGSAGVAAKATAPAATTASAAIANGSRQRCRDQASSAGGATSTGRGESRSGQQRKREPLLQGMVTISLTARSKLTAISQRHRRGAQRGIFLTGENPPLQRHLAARQDKFEHLIIYNWDIGHDFRWL